MPRIKEKIPDLFDPSPKNLFIWLKLAWVMTLLLILTLVIPQISQCCSQGDAPVFKNYSDSIFNGQLPYKDFHFEYPPGAVPLLLPPQIFSMFTGSYILGFAIFSTATFLVLLRYLYSKGQKFEIASLVVLTLPILALTFLEFDIFSAIALYAALELILHKKFSWSAVLFGVAVLIKAYPIVCLPAILIFIPRQKIRPYLATFLGTLMFGVVPFLALSPSGFWWALRYHLERPFEIESGGAAVSFIYKELGGHVSVFISHESYAVSFPHSHLISMLALFAMATFITCLMVWFYKARPNKPLGLQCMALLIGFLLFFKVGSPQYLISIIAVSLIACEDLSYKYKKQLATRLFVLGLIVFATFAVVTRLIDLQWPAELLVVLRYVMLIELLVWVLTRLKESEKLKST